MSSLRTLGNVFTEPGRAMDAVLERSMIALPLFLLVAGNAAVMVWYYQTVDFAWLQDQILGADPNIDAGQREAARAMMSRGTMMVMSVIGAVVALPLLLLARAVYYLLAAKTIGSEIGFGKWFAFAVWTAVPSLLLLPVMALQIMRTTNGQLGLDRLNPLTLDQLVFHLPVGDPWYGLLNSISVVTIWCAAVAVVGLRRWTQRSVAACTFIALLPLLAIYGGWAAFIAMRGGA